jgi:adenylate kinase
VVKLVFLGPPGAGKGTQAARLAGVYNVAHVSTGEILRSNVARQTPLGIQAKEYMNRGDLVPDSLIRNMIEHRLEEPDTQVGWILDGFPRNVNQASFVDELLSKKMVSKEIKNGHEASLFRVINLVVSEEILVERLLARGRADDNEETIRHRLQVHHQETEPLIEFYQKRAQLVSVEGDRLVDDVTKALKEAIDSSYSNN